jgi:hypothetical protein
LIPINAFPRWRRHCEWPRAQLRIDMRRNLRKLVEVLLESQQDLAFATMRRDGYPKANFARYASDGLTVYFAAGPDSPQVQDLGRSARASLAVTAPQADWGDVRAVSMGGIAAVLPQGSAEAGRALSLLRRKFPEESALSRASAPDDIALVKFTPQSIAIVDSRRPFAPTELVEVDADTLGSWI